MRAPEPSPGGFTLLEVLVALAIFSLIVTAGYLALQQGMRVQERLQGEREHWARLESVFQILERDLAHARNRIPRVPGREWSAAFQSPSDIRATQEGTLFRFTRGGHTSFRDGPTSPFQRVAYRRREGELIRAVWSRVDAPGGNTATETVLTGDLDGVEIRFLGPQRGQWHASWPPDTDSDEVGLPRALEVTLAFADRGPYRRLFHVGPPR